jgi:arylsulfatase A-like enzyme
MRRYILLALLLVTASPVLARPNIIVIMTDDQVVSDLEVMSKTRSLLKQGGTSFKFSYASFPLCCPSRSTFLTGQYAHNHRILDNWTDERSGWNNLDHNNALPVWLQAAGYRTIHIGHYLSGTPITARAPGWDDWQLMDGQAYGYRINDNGTILKEGTAPEDYYTDVMSDRAIGSINKALQAGKPFFMRLAPRAPHTEASVTSDPNPRPAPRHLGMFSSKPLLKTPSFNEADVSDKPTPPKGLPLLTQQRIGEITATWRARLATLQAVDDMVGRIGDRLRQAGILNNTAIIFTSDNGYLFGDHRIPEGKRYVYERSARVPLLIRGPGFPAGVVRQQMVMNVDLPATILDLADASPRRALDGLSLLPFAANGAYGAERPIVIETVRRYFALRTPEWVYVEYNDGQKELYDMQADPDQLENLVNRSDLATVREDLAARLSQLKGCQGTGCQVLQ